MKFITEVIGWKKKERQMKLSFPQGCDELFWTSGDAPGHIISNRTRVHPEQEALIFITSHLEVLSVASGS